MTERVRRAAVIEEDMETGIDVDKGSCPYCGSRRGYIDVQSADRDYDDVLSAEWLFARCVDCNHDVFVREVYVSTTNTLEYKIMNMEDPNDS